MPYFFIAGVGSGTVFPQDDTALHRHNEIELVLVEGPPLPFFYGGAPVALPPQRIGAFWAAVPHYAIRSSLARREDSVLHWLTVPLDLFLRWPLPAEFVNAILQGQFVCEHDETTALFDRELFFRWHRHLRQDAPGWRRSVLLEVEARLGQLALSYSGAGGTPHSVLLTQGEIGVIERVVARIASDYRTPLRIADLAREVNLHPNYLSTLFRKTCGVTIQEYRTQHCLWHAQRLLLTTELGVIAIALESGFGSVSQFYHHFQKQNRISPKAFRHGIGNER